MDERPTLATDRLVLRPLEPADATDLQRIAADREIADTTLRIPHPYEDGVAERFIASHAELHSQGRAAQFGIVTRSENTLIGNVGLHIDPDHGKAELGYFVGTANWGNGFATEAAQAVIDYGFLTHSLIRIDAHVMVRNPGSSRVLVKLGMRREGTLRDYILKWGTPEDVEIWSVLRGDWDRGRRDAGSG